MARDRGWMVDRGHPAPAYTGDARWTGTGGRGHPAAAGRPLTARDPVLSITVTRLDDVRTTVIRDRFSAVPAVLGIRAPGSQARATGRGCVGGQEAGA